jgi:3-hydroxybutyryl-CoA dehydratase
MFAKYFEEYEINEKWTSRARTITEADVVNFSAFSGDWFPLHTDKEYAKNTIFKQRIAHGMSILSVATGLILLEPDVVVAFYGMDHVRFKNPTFIGDTIHLEGKVTRIEERDNGRGIVAAQVDIKKQTSQTVALAEMKMMVNKNSTDSSVSM